MRSGGEEGESLRAAERFYGEEKASCNLRGLNNNTYDEGKREIHCQTGRRLRKKNLKGGVWPPEENSSIARLWKGSTPVVAEFSSALQEEKKERKGKRDYEEKKGCMHNRWQRVEKKAGKVSIGDKFFRRGGAAAHAEKRKSARGGNENQELGGQRRLGFTNLEV